MRVKVAYSPAGAAAPERRLVSLPVDLELVADLIRHLRSRVAPQECRPLNLRLDGFSLLPAQRIIDVVRDGDEVTLCGAGGARDNSDDSEEDSPKPLVCSPPASKRPPLVCSPPASKQPRHSLGQKSATSIHSDGISPASREWVDALAARLGSGDAGAGTPVTPAAGGSSQREKKSEVRASAAEELRAAKAAATAALEAAALSSTCGLGAPPRAQRGITSAQAASSAAQVLHAAKAGAAVAAPASAPAKAQAASSLVWSLAPGAKTSAPAPAPAPARAVSSAPKTSGMVVKPRSPGAPAEITHPILGELEVPAGQEPEEFVIRKLKTLQKAIRRQVEWYFGDANWSKDAHLRSLADDTGFVPIAAISDFERLKTLCTDVAFITESVGPSTVVEVSPDDTARLRRRVPPVQAAPTLSCLRACLHVGPEHLPWSTNHIVNGAALITVTSAAGCHGILAIFDRRNVVNGLCFPIPGLAYNKIMDMFNSSGIAGLLRPAVTKGSFCMRVLRIEPWRFYISASLKDASLQEDEAHLIDCLAINQCQLSAHGLRLRLCKPRSLLHSSLGSAILFVGAAWQLTRQLRLTAVIDAYADEVMCYGQPYYQQIRTHQTKKSPGGWMETLKGGGHYNFKQDEDENTKDETDDQDAMAENEAGEEEKDEEDKDQEEKEDEKKEKKEEEKKEEAERRIVSLEPPMLRLVIDTSGAGAGNPESARLLQLELQVQSAGQGSIGKMPGTMPMPTDPIAECRPLKTVSIFHILNLAAPEIMHEFTFVTLVRVVIMFPLVGLFCVGFFWGKDLYNRAKYGYAQVGHPSQMLLMPAFGTTSAVQPSSALDTMMASRLAFISPGRQRPGEFQMTQPLMLQVPSAPLPSAAMRPGLQV
ncbi:unnamed protein product [Polarella glacialis]|uniref:HTH La-type RNA-binding domain-containing protein n=1 Tax=Polarella glacialis TaxID=89957 RepID=A0A813KNX5_POLGL|nr:unnamed protein product [Polarella glacialis]